MRRLAAATAASVLAVPLAALGIRRGAQRLMAAPRTGPGEAGLAPAVDALGGEVVRLLSRDGLRLSGRWLPQDTRTGTASMAEPADAVGDWSPDPHEAILLLHGWTGSVAPDLVEYGPFLRRAAGVLGLDFRGHGLSDDAPTTFGMNEVDDISGALAWLGERGITRVSLVGSSMGGIAALAAVAVLGDGSLPQADAPIDALAAPRDAPRPRIVGIVADAVAPEIRTVIRNRVNAGPLSDFLANRLLGEVARQLGDDPRALEPIRVIALLAPLPILLIHGADDRTVPERDGRRLAAAAGTGAEHWIVPGADHSEAHRAAPSAYEARVTAFLRRTFEAGRA